MSGSAVPSHRCHRRRCRLPQEVRIVRIRAIKGLNMHLHKRCHLKLCCLKKAVVLLDLVVPCWRGCAAHDDIRGLLANSCGASAGAFDVFVCVSLIRLRRCASPSRLLVSEIRANSTLRRDCARARVYVSVCAAVGWGRSCVVCAPEALVG